MKKFIIILIYIFLSLKGFAQEINYNDEQLNTYINNYCKNKNGKVFYKIQNRIIVDCLTSKNLWKITYAENWTSALVESMTYKIYDNFMGNEESSPISGIVLIHENPTDYKFAVKLNQLIRYYNLPISYDEIQAFGNQYKELNNQINKSEDLFENINKKFNIKIQNLN